MLLDAGYSVGAYTSPHFIRYNERFRINGKPASDSILLPALQSVEEARGKTALTYFEFSTLAALQLFADNDLDFALLEVGLGGRLDAVNIVRPDLAIITRVDLDHQDWLGSTREAIGAEKAGILRAHCPLVCADRDPPDSVRKRAAGLGLAPSAYYLGEDFNISEAADASHWLWKSKDQASYFLPRNTLHPDSVAAAIQACHLLTADCSEAGIAASMRRMQLTGRMQYLKIGAVQMLLDVAHNPSAAEHLVDEIRRIGRASRVYAVFAVMADKDWRTMLTIINDAIDAWFLAELPGNDRAEAPGRIAEVLASQGGRVAKCGGTVAANVSAAARQATAADLIVVFGSFFTVAQAITIDE